MDVEGKGVSKMKSRDSAGRGHVWAALLGALAGGLAVALVTRAVPKMMSRMMSEMMRIAMDRMREDGCDMPDA